MKITIRELRETIQSVLSEMPHMLRRNMQGIGPNVDTDVKSGKISAEQLLMMNSKAARALQDELAIMMSPEEFEEYFGTLHPYPKDMLDTFEVEVKDGNFVAYNVLADEQMFWDPKKQIWVPV